MDSILNTIKKLLGLDPDYHDFDVDVIVGINTALMTLNQIGIGKEGFMITDETATWDEFLDGRKDLEAAKTYVFLRTKVHFDPPSQGTVMEAYNAQIREFEFRLYIVAENEAWERSKEGSNE